jgi:hypothetical protein
MTSRDFGIYILTYPGDFHLSSVLVRSIQHVNPDIPIMIIPGEGFDQGHPFDVPIMPQPVGFWAQMGYMDRCFWAFQGPFENFLYLDADMICTSPLDKLRERLTRQQGPFIYVHPSISDEDWLTLIQDPSHPEHQRYARHVKREIGRGPLDRFDPDYNIFENYPFNAGLFASRRLVLTESDFVILNKKEKMFYRYMLKKDWTWKSSDLFFRDQGRLNYLVRKLSIPTFHLRPDLICLAGTSELQVSFDQVAGGSCDFHLIHWMGSLSPSPSWFCVKPLFAVYAFLWSEVGRRTGRWAAPDYRRLPECPGYSLWRHYYELSYGPIPLRVRLHWSWRHVKRTCKLLVRWLKLSVRSEGPGEEPKAGENRARRVLL